MLAGRTVIAERTWDLQCLIDWAATQPEIDKSTILMMGNSGGGVATLYAAACEERIGITVASCSFCGLVGQNGTIHHCDCNAVPGIMRFGEFHDIAGLIAPRHLLINRISSVRLGLVAHTVNKRFWFSFSGGNLIFISRCGIFQDFSQILCGRNPPGALESRTGQCQAKLA